ncbi:MAG: Fe-S cluster assembly protein SufD [Elusimicrobia bacterium]|nr:Fe-S cluster assembly protein SufD [Elusimicrobiota bacterium]
MAERAPLTETPVSVSRLSLDDVGGGDPSELAGIRARAYGHFARFAWPTKEDEAWRRTDLSGLNLDGFVLGPSPSAPLPDVPEAFKGFVGADEALVLWGAGGGHRRVPAEMEAKGVIFLDLAEAYRQRPDLVGPALAQSAASLNGKFSALSAALWTRGIFVYVPKGVDAGVVLRGGYAPVLSEGQAAVSRTLIVAEAGSRLTFLEDYAAAGPGSEGDGLSVSGVDIVAGDNADVTYVNFQRQGRNVNHFFQQNARLARDARLTTLAAALGGRLSRADYGSHLMGEGATAKLYGLVFGEGDQRLTHHASQHHQAPRTFSDLLFKAALTDRARSIFTGMIRIEKTAAKSEAYQASKNVLLSRTARANAIPMLEILTDDVKCGHGAAVGGLDDDQRFYLMSRGLDRHEAERAMVEGFFEDVLQRVPVPSLHERLRAMIDEKLGRGGG